MSHTSTITDIVFSDIPSLKAAVRELKAQGIKCELVQDQKPRAFYANQVGMDVVMPWVLKLHDARYDVGFVYDDKLKGHTARTDLFGGSVAGVLGVTPGAGESAGAAALGKLNLAYGLHATTRQYVMKGYQVSRTVRADGHTLLTITGFK